MTTRRERAVWMGLGALVASQLSGCGVGGFRAMGNGCPAGETCSTEVSGLYFEGAKTSDQVFGGGLMPVAVGGFEEVTITSGALGDAFTRPFQARAAGSTFAVSAVAPPVVSIRGRSSGTADLRILTADGATLYDRIDVTSAAVARVSARPLETLLRPNDAIRNGEPWALFAGGHSYLLVTLTDAHGARLADTHARLFASSPSGQPAWDALDLTAPMEGEVEITAVNADEVSYGSVIVPVVDTIERIAPVAYDGARRVMPSSLRRSELAYMCFRAEHGGQIVVGAPWTYETGGVLRLGPNSRSSASETSASERGPCVELTSIGRGAARLSVTAGDRVATYAFSITE